MLRLQGYKFELLRPTGEQLRNMRRFAGARRFALALNNEMHTLVGRKHSHYQMDKLIPAWKEEFPWLSEVPSQTLQQALKDAILSLRNPHYRQVLLYTFLGGMDERDLAACLHVQVQEVYMWRCRALKAIRNNPEVMRALQAWRE